jgi:excisionase family DNA binding protein
MAMNLSHEAAPSTGASDGQAAFATAIEAAQFLRLSKAMVHKLICDGKIPACRYGRLARIPWSWLHQQAQEGRQ